MAFSPKHLITGGCSYSFVNTAYAHKTWAYWLEKDLGLNGSAEHTGLPAQGNGLISRRIIHALLKTLKHVNAEDLLVGIMWSGSNRHEVFLHDPPGNCPDQSWENPTKFVKEGRGRWFLLNHHWDWDYSQNYYRYYHDRVGSLILTLEHILRVQWFLNLHKIKYFMCPFTLETLPPDLISHSDVVHLYDAIDFQKWLPVQGAYEWARDFSGIPFNDDDLSHLNSEQNLIFLNQVIKPFIKDNL